MSRRHKALLIGIQDYNPPGTGGPDLKGCVNDITDMFKTLVALGFPAGAIRKLPNEHARKANILDNISWLVTDNEPGDFLVFYYSGHGSYKFRKLPDNTIVKEQVIRPYHSLQQITISELKERFADLKTDVHIEVFMDCCHSGPPEQHKSSEKPVKDRLAIRFLPPLKDDGTQPDFKTSFREEHRFFHPKIVLSPKASITRWAACGIDQLARETMIGAEDRGVFTHHLCSILRSTQGDTSRAELNSLVRTAIRDARFEQVPQLEADTSSANKPIFT